MELRASHVLAQGAGTCEVVRDMWKLSRLYRAQPSLGLPRGESAGVKPVLRQTNTGMLCVDTWLCVCVSLCVCVCVYAHFIFAVSFGRVGVYVCHYTWFGGNVNQKMQPRQMLTFILFMIDKPVNHMFACLACLSLTLKLEAVQGLSEAEAVKVCVSDRSEVFVWMEQSCWIEFSGYVLPKFNGSNILGVKLSHMKAYPSWIAILPVYFPWPTFRQSPPLTDGHVDWKRPWNWRDWQLYLTSGGQGRSKANIKVKSQRDVKYGISGSHAFLPKVYEPCTANLSRH